MIIEATRGHCNKNMRRKTGKYCNAIELQYYSSAHFAHFQPATKHEPPIFLHATTQPQTIIICTAGLL
jgi:hypothetical protein